MLQSTLGQAQRFKKRERTQNWAYEEKHFLLELCRKDMHIIENKRLDSALTMLKNRAWKIIHQQFAIAFGTDRNCNRLKEQWRRMKACTRAEMLDYQQRIQRFGQEVADRKKPSQFTFEIWEFMQEAKKVCKNELMDDVDYSKIKLSLEENLPHGVSIKDCSDENDDESSSMWEKTSQNICEVQIKEDSQDELEEYEKGPMAKYPRMRGFSNASSPFGAPVVSAADTARFNELLASSFANHLSGANGNSNSNSNSSNNNNNNNGSTNHNHSINNNNANNNNNNNSSSTNANKLLEAAGLELYNRTAAAAAAAAAASGGCFGSESSLVDLTGGNGNASAASSQLDLSNTLEALNLLKNRFHRISQMGHWKTAFQEAHGHLSSANHPPPDSPTLVAGGSNHGGGSGVGMDGTSIMANGGIDLISHNRIGSPPPAPPSMLPAGGNGAAGAAGGPSMSPESVLARAIEQQHRQSEHELRMEILKTDLATAKINQETAELNRQLVLQKLRQTRRHAAEEDGVGGGGGLTEDDAGEEDAGSSNNVSNLSITVGEQRLAEPAVSLPASPEHAPAAHSSLLVTAGTTTTPSALSLIAVKAE
ncbi:myosin-G heavy chain-like [Anopheles albimanus]|uniref:myosin-G heavy chain-like n=1 Tax=Anopheles albimanus TaxID=7167 RepID=UPI00163F0902|nr:myosin-G heavy chain-like [Anopheles albimanus]XP_035788932.1 myosin-G heavy chain-like [Anopheles albimanus]XP_035788933.1 myosin-G heavy chain-like [Anopheles albimanus]XP_035788934.1 myosin-G heavy chain-like [Anopheles albimanus]XP_035788935.1 myosin-G heavy chain-like [Anopheles albimanus]XP_035788936.1 myosin-G heavy chain-like [Anopheles albimanus]XP_035788937.1 myosin-G heavy chain-like [Anopheles albimanus]XP_035788938.1 myosin-G heavy chain-like [Anopheles albimanus]XP_03578893